jgi:hypothetical protein
MFISSAFSVRDPPVRGGEGSIFIRFATLHARLVEAFFPMALLKLVEQHLSLIELHPENSKNLPPSELNTSAGTKAIAVSGISRKRKLRALSDRR